MCLTVSPVSEVLGGQLSSWRLTGGGGGHSLTQRLLLLDVVGEEHGLLVRLLVMVIVGQYRVSEVVLQVDTLKQTMS